MGRRVIRHTPLRSRRKKRRRARAMRICFDLDNTLCSGKPYKEAWPLPGARALLSRLKAEGHTIIIYTARGMKTACSNMGAVMKNIGVLTLQQLDEWRFEYDEIYFGKPCADLYIDDKAYPVNCLDKLEIFIENAIQAQCKIDEDVKKCSLRIDGMLDKLNSITE